MTWRRLDSLIEQLPPESRTQTALREEYTPAELWELAQEAAGPEHGHGPWSVESYRLADLIDAVRENTAATIAAGGVKPDPVRPYRRPGVLGRGESKPMSDAGIAYLEDMRARHRARQEEAAQQQ